MILLFELTLLAALIATVLKTDIHPGALACLYLIGWMTPWIIPQAINGGFGWQSLGTAAAVFLGCWLLLWAINRLNGHPARWAVAGSGSLILAIAF